MPTRLKCAFRCRGKFWGRIANGMVPRQPSTQHGRAVGSPKNLLRSHNPRKKNVFVRPCVYVTFLARADSYVVLKCNFDGGNRLHGRSWKIENCRHVCPNNASMNRLAGGGGDDVCRSLVTAAGAAGADEEITHFEFPCALTDRLPLGRWLPCPTLRKGGEISAWIFIARRAL